MAMLLSAVCSLYIFNHTGLVAATLTMLLPFYAITTYRNPTVSVYMLIFYCFAIFVFSRYFLEDFIPAGTLYDAMLLIGYLIAWLVKGNTQKIQWSRILDTPFLVLILWWLYCCFSIMVPGNPGLAIWILAVRVHLYMVLSIPLFIMLLDIKTLKTVLILWGILSIIMSVKGFFQLHIGLDEADKLFLEGNRFHMVGGKLRVFSYCSDAGQFGVQQGHAATIGALLFLTAKNGKQRLFFMLMALTGLYGMFASGTRGAIFVIFGGALAYCFLVRRIKLLLLGLFIAGGFYCFMSYTNIGSSVYAVQRMRTAFKPEQDPSYIARKINQATLKSYLRYRPFGGGLGAMQHGPKGTVLADTPFDSGYVLVWGDQGIVGLSIYIGMILLFLLKGTIVLWSKIKNEWLRGILIAVMASLVGVAIANYGNPVMMQHPTCVLYFLSVAIIYAAPRLDKSLQPQEEKQVTSTQMIHRR